ncbi:MAG: hypothetical protein CME38_15450 [Haliea sp.]|nr:hypothetical protein [Haliea sp.]|tara:strand:+ start:3022 stop:3372 length:351 start_codon:yes stop_codon:yes gene_type:complete
MSQPYTTLAAFIFTLAAASQLVAQTCMERAITLAQPIFPRVFCGSRSIEDVQHCFNVRLSFDLSADGKVTQVTPVDIQDGCSSFISSASRALLNFSFAPGQDETSCTYHYEFFLEP